MPRRAFTLVEVLIVVIILGILAAAIIPQFTEAADESRAGTAAIIVKSMMRKIATEKARNGTYPTTIETAWFEGDQLPTNPYFPDATTTIQVANSAANKHPGTKTNANGGAFWYNKANGIIRARVLPQADDAATIALYNTVNSCKITALNQTD